jgi:DNA repair exonuclease SbcCD ATPase subunit
MSTPASGERIKALEAKVADLSEQLRQLREAPQRVLEHERDIAHAARRFALRRAKREQAAADRFYEAEDSDSCEEFTYWTDGDSS